MAKSCRDCPSFLTAHDVPPWGRSVGAPVCARYGTVLGKPGLPAPQERMIQEHIAEECPKFGEPKPGSPEKIDMTIMLPDITVRDPQAIDPALQTINTCASCKNLIPELTVAQETGYSAGLCAAKGKLILGNRMSYEGRDCEFRQFGATRGTTSGLFFMPEYSDAFTASADPVMKILSNEAFVDPTDYVTDKPVTDEDEQFGIRAWRRVVDPNGSGNEIMLPIFDPMYFDDEERARIPRTGDDEHPELYVDHFGGVYGLGVAWLGLDETPMLNGQPGVGKTELFRHMAWLMCAPFRRITVTASMEIDDLFGKYEFINGETKFRLGYLPIAWTQPGVLVIDEPNTGRPEVWQRLRPLTDNSKQLVMDMWDSRQLARHDDCYMGMAINPAWDVRNVGALEIGDADVRRTFHFWVDMPPEAIEKKIIRDRVKLDGWEIEEQKLEYLMKTAKSLRDLGDQGFPHSWAVAQQIKVARALRWFDPITAYRRALGDYLDPETHETLLDQVRANWRGLD